MSGCLGCSFESMSSSGIGATFLKPDFTGKEGRAGSHHGLCRQVPCNHTRVGAGEELGYLGRVSCGPIQSFLIPRILDAMQRLGELNYHFDVPSDGYLTGIHIEFPSGLADANVLRRIKRLTGPISWTFEALSEK